jgi:hypothetical protein
VPNGPLWERSVSTVGEQVAAVGAMAAVPGDRRVLRAEQQDVQVRRGASPVAEEPRLEERNLGVVGCRRR